MATILCIAAPSDPATSVGAFWMQKFAYYAASKGHKVIYQKTPTLQVLYKALAEYDPQLVVANGHGGYKSLRIGDNVLFGTKGYDAATKYTIKEGDTEWFRGRIFLSLTCNSGKELVPALVKAGALAAMGYKKPYIFLSYESLTPDQDTSAKPFFEALLQPAIQLADGATFKEAIQATRASFKHYIKEDLDPDGKKYLSFDFENLVAIGDPSVKLI